MFKSYFNYIGFRAVVSLSLILGVAAVPADLGLDTKAVGNPTFTIDKTWNGTIVENGSISISLSLKCDSSSVKSLLVEIDAPFYDDPKAPNASVTDPFPGLWDYEVVEAFFLGNDEQYLEIELAPSGHYLLLYLNGVRNDTNQTLPLTSYTTHVNGTSPTQRWYGQAFIPLKYFPSNVTKFNAYAIHNSDPDRVYMSLYPVNQTLYPNQTQPDFHFLEAFGDLDFDSEFNPNATDCRSGASGLAKINLLGGWIILLAVVSAFAWGKSF